MMLTALAGVLRTAGLTVVEEKGWQTRGRPWAKKPVGIVQHHTGPGALAGQIRVVRDGRSDLPGPLSQFVVAENGTVHLIAAGRSNHAGRSAWGGFTDVNDDMLGIESDNDGDGKDVWEQSQIQAIARVAAACAMNYGFPASMVAGHKEICIPKGRKIDPTYDMPVARRLVADIMGDLHSPAGQLPPNPIPVPTVNPERAMLQKGDEGPDVLELQGKLRALGFKLAVNGVFGWETYTRLGQYQEQRGLKKDHLAGPKVWSALEKE